MRDAIILSREGSIAARLLVKRYNYLIGFLLRSALVGIIAGAVGVAFRLALTEGEAWRHSLLMWARTIPGWGWLVLPVLGGLAGALAGWLTGFAPETAGSGIPHVEAVLSRQRRLMWWRIIPVKFIAGALAIGAGLSLGREGPTVQMGAAAGQAVSKSILRTKTEELQLIACGAGAGLAAAFNAPLAGVVFVLEELRRNFSPYVLIGTLAASITADLITQRVLGPLPTFRVPELLTALPLAALPLFVVLGALAGVLGTAFNRCLLGSLDIAERFNRYHRWLRVMVITFLAGLVGYFLPTILGGGHLLAQDVLAGRVALTLIPIIFVTKFVLTMVSYSAGVPGGIFLPLLVLGALMGSLVGQVGSLLLPAAKAAVPFFAVAGMAAYFVAIVRSPLTGIVLTIELTGTCQHMLPLLIACLVAYLVAEAMGSLPVYEMLLERDLTKGRREDNFVPTNEDKMLVVETVVESGAGACGCRVQDMALPQDCLLVTVNRGSREIIPRGNTRLLEGDHLTIIVSEARAGEIIAELNQKTCCQLRA